MTIEMPPCLPNMTARQFFEAYWREASLPLRIILRGAHFNSMVNVWHALSDCEKLEVAALAWPPYNNEEEEGR